MSISEGFPTQYGGTHQVLRTKIWVLRLLDSRANTNEKFRSLHNVLKRGCKCGNRHAKNCVAIRDCSLTQYGGPQKVY